jgi:hypothetical protein
MPTGTNQRVDDVSYNRTIIVDINELYNVTARFVVSVCNSFGILIEDVIPFIDSRLPNEDMHSYSKQLKELTAAIVSMILLQLIIQEISVHDNPLTDQYNELLVLSRRILSSWFPGVNDILDVFYKLELELVAQLLSDVPLLDTYHLRVNSFKMESDMILLSTTIRESKQVGI